MTTASERLRGNTGLFLTFKIGAATAFVADKDVKKAELVPEEADDNDLTFAEAAAGDSTKFGLELTAIQSTVATSLHSFLWENPGAEMALVYGPHGNAIPTADKPHYTATVKATGRPKIGGEARRGKEGQDFEYTLEVLTPITKVTA